MGSGTTYPCFVGMLFVVETDALEDWRVRQWTENLEEHTGSARIAFRMPGGLRLLPLSPFE